MTFIALKQINLHVVLELRQHTSVFHRLAIMLSTGPFHLVFLNSKTFMLGIILPFLIVLAYRKKKRLDVIFSVRYDNCITNCGTIFPTSKFIHAYELYCRWQPCILYLQPNKTSCTVVRVLWNASVYLFKPSLDLNNQTVSHTDVSMVEWSEHKTEDLRRVCRPRFESKGSYNFLS